MKLVQIMPATDVYAIFKDEIMGERSLCCQFFGLDENGSVCIYLVAADGSYNCPDENGHDFIRYEFGEERA